jgi:cytidylate kinase
MSESRNHFAFGSGGDLHKVGSNRGTVLWLAAWAFGGALTCYIIGVRRTRYCRLLHREGISYAEE